MLGRGVCAIFVLINGCVRETNDLHPGVLFFFRHRGLLVAVLRRLQGPQRETDECVFAFVCVHVCVSTHAYSKALPTLFFFRRLLLNDIE